jgi:hypothetical protein
MVTVTQPYSGPGESVPLYRHYDGHPGEAGATLLEILRGNPRDTEAVVAALLSVRYEDGRPTYRAATWKPEDQGDLEHVYHVERVDGAWTVTHYARPGWTEGASDKPCDWPHARHSLAEFLEVVNRDRKQMNARAAEIKRTRGVDLGPDYPMLTL